MGERTRADRQFDWNTGRELERKDAEIERLREALERITHLEGSGDYSERLLDTIEQMREVARTALKAGNRRDADGGHK